MTRNGSRFSFVVSSLLWLPVAAVGSVASCAESTEVSLQACSTDLTDCAGVCVDTATDDANCGACGEACPGGQTCQRGACGGSGEGGSGGATCGAGLTDCMGVCIDTGVDPQHCGGCDVACTAGQTCSGGSCQGGCAAELTPCGSACVDTRSDPRHCGGCNNACSPGGTCAGSLCTCSVDPSENIGSAVPRTVNGTTAGAPDTRAISCSAAGTADQTFLFTAPTTGTFLFDTLGSRFDTALGALLVGSCDQLACNAAIGAQPQISADLNAGDGVLLVVSGVAGAEGSFVLNIGQPAPAVCEPVVLDPTVPQTQMGTTSGRTDTVTTSCNPAPGPDATYAFTAPADGLYLFSGAGSFISPIVEVLDGGTCLGASLGCAGGPGGAPLVTAPLVTGQTVLVAVEAFAGAAGSYTLSIDTAPP